MTHKYLSAPINILVALASFVSCLCMNSCNAKEEETVTDDYVSTESVAVTAFSLSADARVMRNLDSVYFSIDLEHGVIFNADSLPKGTKVVKLIPKITYPSSVKSAVIEMTGGTHREGTVKYHSNVTDTIDFTGKVTLTLSTADDAITKTYDLKVNVHQQDPDTIYWDRMSSINLPSRLPNPADQKTVRYNQNVLSLILESDASYTLATTSDIFSGVWNKDEIKNPGFTPVLRTLTASADNLFLLSDDGNLMMSEDGKTWSAVDNGWNEIIGMYGLTLLGTRLEGTSLSMTSYPASVYTSIDLPEGFPLTGFTTPIEFTNRWTPDPTIIIFGGYPFADSGKSPAWAFDGSQWVNIAENSLPALTGLSVMNYYSYLNNASNGNLKEFEVYLAFGGKDEDGNLNRTIYLSYDHGINWQRAQEYTQLPESVTAGYQVDALAIGTTMESNLSNRWEPLQTKRRLPFEIDGDIIRWECPYIFLFGGFDSNMKLIPEIRSGVLERLTFEPLF